MTVPVVANAGDEENIPIPVSRGSQALSCDLLGFEDGDKKIFM